MQAKTDASQVYISAVVPMFNEEESLGQLYDELTAALDATGRTYEVVLVDDGSSDRTAELAQDLCDSDDRLMLVRLSRNFGHHPASTCGMSHTSGDVVVLLDADLQNDPVDIPRLLEKIEEGYDVARCWRQGRKDPFWRTFPSKCVNWLTCKATGVKLHDYGCSMLAMRRCVVNRMMRFTERSRHVSGLISWSGGKVCEIKVRHRERKFGSSKYGILSLIKLTINLMTGFSTIPLQLVGLLGVATSLLGFIGAIYLVIKRYVYGVDLDGVVVAIAIIFVFIGINFLALGVMGEYIGRIFSEVQARPYYIVDTVYRKRSEKGDDEQ
ncbi:MAG: glycosyltransferase [Candidatus Coatesbacteria bacterium]|nr:glycosyltransferase [Candidatus Coatesbacteria bacterium]